MRAKAINILQHLLADNTNKRLLDLLKHPDNQHPQDWYMYVPSCFNDALDIRKIIHTHNKKKTLTWTQGKLFSFKRGDTLYDTPLAYEEQWSQALKVINFCVLVKDAQNVTPAWKKQLRTAGFVCFSICVPNKNKTNLIEQDTHELTQDDFVKFLIQGFQNK